MNAPPRRRRLVPLAGILTVLVFLGLVARFWNPVYGFTAFFQLDASNDHLKLDAFHRYPVYVYRDTGGYDGLYYAQIALDPSLRNPQLPRAMDNLGYRARRILPPALAWLLGAGRPLAVITAYSVLNVIVWLALAALLWRVLAVADFRGWLAWAGVLFSAGALFSVRLALTDLTGAALAAAAIAAAERQRKRSALTLLAAAGLARETSLTAVMGLVKPPWVSFKNTVRVILACLPLALWLAYIRYQVGPTDEGWSNLTWPVLGLVGKWDAAVHAALHWPDQTLAWTTLLALAGLTVQAAYILIRPQPGDRWWRVGAGSVVLMLCLGTAVWEGFPGAATRVLLPLTIAFNVLACRRRAALAWLLAGNLTVFSGLLALRDVPSDPHELAAARSGATACIARVGGGWYGREQDPRHVWVWARQHGTINLKAWPQTTARVQLRFGLRAISPREVDVRLDGREVWHGEVGTSLSRETVEVAVPGGRAQLRFSTASPPRRESTAANARELGFALYDLRLRVPEH